MTLEERATEILRNDKRMKAIAREAVVQAIHEIWDAGMERPYVTAEKGAKAIRELIDKGYKKPFANEHDEPFLPS